MKKRFLFRSYREQKESYDSWNNFNYFIVLMVLTELVYCSYFELGCRLYKKKLVAPFKSTVDRRSSLIALNTSGWRAVVIFSLFTCSLLLLTSQIILLPLFCDTLTPRQFWKQPFLLPGRRTSLTMDHIATHQETDLWKPTKWRHKNVVVKSAIKSEHEIWNSNNIIFKQQPESRWR